MAATIGRGGASGRPVLLTGATGYVGGRLMPRLEAAGRSVRCLVREPARWAGAAGRDVVRGDAALGRGLGRALRGIETAYYLIHSMGSGRDFEETDRRAARRFGRAARAAGVQRIVYLGGLADETRPLSPHLRSRIEVGRLLRASGVPVVELRASIVLGAGSASFEMIRGLVERLPILVTPLYARVGRHLVDSIRHPSVVTDPGARRDFRVVPGDVATAIARALEPVTGAAGSGRPSRIAAALR